VYREKFLGSIKDRLDTAAVKGKHWTCARSSSSPMARVLTKKRTCFKI